MCEQRHCSTILNLKVNKAGLARAKPKPKPIINLGPDHLVGPPFSGKPDPPPPPQTNSIFTSETESSNSIATTRDSERSNTQILTLEKMPVMEKLKMFVVQEPVVAASCLIAGVGLFLPAVVRPMLDSFETSKQVPQPALNDVSENTDFGTINLKAKFSFSTPPVFPVWLDIF
ncbi:UNVERIFIED_CONTAM: hypothetical protein Sradi_0497600 [Sesamum radiatum]|uniref:Uncharacterized protein n=1 Tax=Sesamum radiatum TaxID=300843 RepID=A0AAW2VJZ4_SESRA